MKTVVLSLLTLAFCLAPSTASANVDVAPVPVVKEKLYIDESGVKPLHLGRWNSKDITVDYDLNYLQHVIFVDGEIYRHDGSLNVEVDSVSNRARLERAGRHVDIDFGKRDALIRLGYFMSPRPGFKRRELAYTLKTDSNDFSDYHGVYIAELPDDTVKYAQVMRIIVSQFKDSPGKDIPTFSDLVKTKAQIDLASFNEDGQKYRAAAPAELVTFMTGNSNLVEWIPVFINDSTITMNTVINMTYPAGGCSAMYDEYTTYRIGKDGSMRTLSADDLFKPGSLNDVRRMFVDALARKYGDSPGITDIYLSFYDKWTCLDEEARYLIDVGEMRDEVQSLVDAGDYSHVCIPRAAIVPDGVMFTYDEQCIEDFGELGNTTILLPTKEIRGCLNAEYAGRQRR